MRSQKEKEIQRDILDYLQYAGVFAWKVNNAGIYKPDTGTYIPTSLQGVADIIGVKNGRFVAIEVKSATGKLSPFQQAFLDRVQFHGGIAFVARSVGDVEIQLKAHSLL